eukprot:2386002-Karenia_brevis.AAC.1
MIRNAAFHWCQSGGLSPELEKPGLLQARPLQGALPKNGVKETGDGRRPADVYVPRWRRGMPAAFDFAVTSGLRADNVSSSLQDAGQAARNYEDFKRSHNNTEADCQAAGISFIPIVIEAVGGGLGPAAFHMFRELAKIKSTASGESRSTT